MINLRHIWILLMVLFPLIPAHAQLRDFNFRFKARIVADDSASTVLRDCHIINKTLNLGTVSDQFGDFTITANRKDSIEFSILGYENLRLAVADSMFSNNRVIRLKSVTYLLSSVDVGRYSNYGQFKRDFMNTKVEQFSIPVDPINRFEVAPRLLPGQGGINLVPFYISPVTYLYNLLSREGHQMKYLQKILDGTAEHIRIGEKFNGDIVHQLTGLENDELVEFMSGCHFSKEYLLYMPQEEINREVVRKYKEYKNT
ncbi:MAG: hypothetical protein LBV39_04835, partial [Bacteroidales bacterium]|nr:hypothetical protein [Bacteroidales bacterium]